MAYQVSPGIEVKEYDISGYVPGVSTTTAAIGGVFSWGPVEQRTLISNESMLTSRFGIPNDDNYETFMIAANFLAYSDSLYVSRAIDDKAFNAAVGENVPPTLIKNLSDFKSKQDGLSENAQFFAKYPSKLGNSLVISICASRDAFGSVINTSDVNNHITLTFEPNSTVAKLSITNINGDIDPSVMTEVLEKLTPGDYLTAISDTAGLQYIKYNDHDEPKADGSTITVNLNLDSRYTLASEAKMTEIRRNWEYFQLFDRYPGTSSYVQQRGGSGDELHLVIIDKYGKFTGVPNQVVEKYTSLSRAKNAKSESGSTNYYKDVLNDSSMYVWAHADVAGIVSDEPELIKPISVDVFKQSFAGGTDSASESTITLSPLAKAYDQFQSKDDVDISLIIAGRTSGGLHGEGLANYIIDNIASVRKDCIVFISPAITDVVGANFREIDNVVEFRRAVRYTDRAVLTTSYKYQFDRYNNKNRWVAGCGDDAGLVARTDHDRDPWWSPAGQNRGVYKNVIKLAWSPNKAALDVIYKEDIDPVINQVGSGVILYGDKTLLGKPSAFSRINVRRLFDTLEKAIEKYSRGLLFEFNNVQTRARFRNTVEPYLRDVMGRQGIVRFKVVCDETNNTATVIDNNQFVGSIFIVPSNSINFITLNFVALSNSVSFEYAIGELQNIVNAS